jgi:hypothetical protein
MVGSLGVVSPHWHVDTSTTKSIHKFKNKDGVFFNSSVGPTSHSKIIYLPRQQTTTGTPVDRAHVLVPSVTKEKKIIERTRARESPTPHQLEEGELLVELVWSLMT